MVLGQIIAHDIGHLVLGEGAHTDSGIMKEDLHVHVYNSARISMSDPIKAEAEAASMFQKAKIKVTWVESLMAREVKSHSVRDEALNPTPLQLRICTR